MLAPAALLLTIVVTAPFQAAGTIPARYTCDGGDRPPVIGWAATYPTGTPPPRHPFAVEVVDLDAPGGVFVHWLKAGHTEGRNSFGSIGWRGPCPPRGDPPHHYAFRVYLLDHLPPLRRGFTDAQLRTAIQGDVVAAGEIVGRYRRRPRR